MKFLKHLTLILALLFIAACLFACTQPTEPPVDDPSDIPEDTPSEYDITSFKIAGNDISQYTVVANRAIKEYYDTAMAVKATVLEKTGITLEFQGNADPSRKVIQVKEVQNAGESGFRIYEKNGNFYIETAYRYLTPSAIDEFVNTVIASATGTLEFAEGYTYQAPIKTVKYSDFGAVGDGVTDDYAAIKSAHDEANKYGYYVEGDANATYYIGAKGLPTVIVKTSTDWKGAKFIIDDREINTPTHASMYIPVFTVQPSLLRVTISTSDVPSLEKDASNLGFAPGVDCLVYVQYNGVKHYIRYGNNANNGSYQQEILLVRADGSIDKNTRPMWDYPEINDIYAIPIDEVPITVQNGSFKTLANTINPTKYEQVDRGIVISRSNTTIKNVSHTVEQVESYRAAYGGIFKTRQCNNILIYNCEIFCHKDSYFTHPENGDKVLLGSYELSASHCNNVKYEKVVQTNFFDVEGVTVHNQGLMGTNYCKNMYVIDSMFARFDAHCQVYNLTVKKSDLQRVNTIGAGTVKIENTNIWGSYIADLRSDYGGFFDGDFHLKNVTIKYTGSNRLALFSGNWANHNFGYTVVKPQNVYIDNLKVDNGTPVYLYTYELDGRPDLTAETVNGEVNLNPIVPTKLVQIISNPANTVFRKNIGPTFANTVIEYLDEEGDAGNQSTAIIGDYLVNCGFNDELKVNEDGFVTSTTAATGGNGYVYIYNFGNEHNFLNIRLTKNGDDQALLFSGSGNPGGVTKDTNICVDVKPTPTNSNTDPYVYQDYKGKSFVVAFDIKPLEKTSDINDGKTCSLFTFSNFYSATNPNFVQSGIITMSLTDYSLSLRGSDNRQAQSLNTTLEVGKFSTIAMHVKVLENKFDLYINGELIIGDLPFLSNAEIASIGTYDMNGNLVDSQKENKMEDFLIGYARLARINGWNITGDVYEFDNAKLYFSETYLGTGDLKNQQAPIN